MQCDTGLDVVFYDRKNRCEVRASQLVHTKAMAYTYAIDPNSLPETFQELNSQTMTVVDGEGRESEYPASHIHATVVSDIGYRTEGCPKYQNFDMETMVNDLVFLRFEDLPGEESRWKEKLELEKENNQLREALREIRMKSTDPAFVHDTAYEALTGRKP